MKRSLLAWWRADRIRVSPREGRLLALTPPCLLIIQGETYQIIARRQAQCRAGSIVIYTCQGDPGCFDLRLRTEADIRWGKDQTLAVDEIEVWG